MTMVRSAALCMVWVLTGLIVGADNPPRANGDKSIDGSMRQESKDGTKAVVTDSSPADRVLLITADGQNYTIVRDELSEMLFLDPKWHERSVRLSGRLQKDSKAFKLDKIQSVKDGKVFDVDYWCDNCQLAYAAPGKCVCCGGDTVL